MNYLRPMMTLVMVAATVLAVAAPSLALPISGEVTFADGSPAAGALVEIIWPKDGGKTITNASGGYTFDLASGYYGLRATLGEFAANHDLYFTLGGDGKPDRSLDMRLVSGAVIVGKLVDKTTGKPVGGAKIMLRYWRDTETDDNGIFRFVGVPRTNHTITAVKEGLYRPIIAVSALNKAYIEVPIETKPEGVISGVVTDDSGKPIAGARVGAARTYFDFQQVKTDANGHYTLQGCDPDQRSLISVFADGYDSVYEQPILFPSSKREVTADFKLRSKKGDIRSILGRVTRTDGAPIANATVAYGWTDCAQGYTTAKTDAEGKYILKNVDNGHNIVVAEATGFAPAFKYVEAKVDKQVDLAMEPGHWVEGRFVDEDSKPVEGVGISLDVETPEMDKMGFCGNEPYRWVSARATSDKDGRFRLENLPAGRILIETYASGYSRINQKPLQVDRKDHVITLTRPGQVLGTVVSAVDGKPIKEFQVGRGYDERGTSFTGTDGRFTISSDFQTPGCKIDLFVQAPGYMRAYIRNAEVRSASKADFNAIKVRLRPSRPLSGVITETSTGKPLEGVTVTLLDTSVNGLGWFQWKHIPEAWHASAVKTDARGAFRVETVPAKHGSVLLEKSGYARTLLPDVDFLKPVRAAVSAGATVKGVVTDEGGKPLSNVRITVAEVKGHNQYDSAKTDERGEFRFTDLPPGDLLVEQHSENRVVRIHEFKAVAGQEHIVDWNRPEPAQVNGKITIDGAPVEAAHVMIHYVKGGMYAGFADTAKDGTYSFKVHRPGDYRITYSKGDWMDPNHIWVRDKITIKPGSNHFSVAFPSASISGRLIDSKTGQPIPNADLQAYILQTEKEHDCVAEYSWEHTNPVWWPQNKVKTDATGNFKIENIKKGEWAIAVSSEPDSSSNIPCLRVRIGKDEKKTGVIARMPRLGSAEIRIVDAGTGKPVPDARPVCVNDWGFAFYPIRDESKSGGVGCGGPSCLVFKTGPNGGTAFPSLPPGKYTAHVQTQSYMPAKTAFEVKPGQTTKVVARLVKGQKIVFRLTKAADEAVPGFPWVGYKIKSPGKTGPVLSDYHGPYWGSVAFLTGDSPRKAEIPIEPGTYDLQMVLRNENGQGVLSSEKNLWSGRMRVRVVKGKYTVIDIPWGK